MHRSRVATLAILAAVALGALTGCAAGTAGAPGSTDAAGSDSSMSAPMAKGEALDASVADGINGLVPGEAPAPPAAVAQQHVISTADVTLQSAHPDAAADQVAQVAQELGGSVESLSISRATGDSPEGASLTVRVPPARLDAAIEQFAQIGEVVSQTRFAQDVTTEYVDLEARVNALETSVKRLTDLIAGAATTSEVIEAEAALTQRQQELDGLRAQFKALDGQVSEATIWVTISAPSVLPGGGPGSFWEGLVAGLDSLAAAGAGALVVLGVALPWLVVAAIIAVATVAIMRSRRSRRARAVRPDDQTLAQP